MVGELALLVCNITSGCGNDFDGRAADKTQLKWIMRLIKKSLRARRERDRARFIIHMFIDIVQCLYTLDSLRLRLCPPYLLDELCFFELINGLYLDFPFFSLSKIFWAFPVFPCEFFVLDFAFLFHWKCLLSLLLTVRSSCSGTEKL